MNILYIDPSNSGISGDMLLASLLNALDDRENIIRELHEIKHFIEGVSSLKIELVKRFRHEIKVSHLKIEIEEQKHHRSTKILKNVLNTFMEQKGFSEEAKNYANNVLQSLIKAEASVHDTLEDKVHLHELSSIDTLLDILGVTRCLEKLGVFAGGYNIFCNTLPLGGGYIKGAHGLLPIPAPATVEILKNSKIPVANGPIEEELVTPTGAALLVNLSPKAPTKTFSIEEILSSTGKKEFKDFLNILRIYIGEDQKTPSVLKEYVETISVLETDVDDITGEILGNFISILEEENVLDIQIFPSLTKKNRPSHIIKVLCHPKDKFEIMELMIKELGTLGVRFNTINRVCIKRTFEKVDLKIKNENYSVNYKISFTEEENKKTIINIKPEFDDLKKISDDSGLPIKIIQIYAQREIELLYSKFDGEEE
ncbi:MAG: hypothetical protein BAJALOKI2v1_640023 [Promethearchaeota archaeon]|nr:MAG: hypothetical protein BAJALOKI2v1_640023 [Candidatus Lokiarchaeota archaeon]